MKPALSLRDLSVILGALALGLAVGYELKASADKNRGSEAPVVSSAPCLDASISITANAISASSGIVTPGDSHVQSIACVGPGRSITWSSSDKTVSSFHVFFDESPCEANDVAKLYDSDNTKTITCPVKNKTTLGAYKYELVVDTGATSHTYFDPIVIVGAIGILGQ